MIAEKRILFFSLLSDAAQQPPQLPCTLYSTLHLLRLLHD